MLVLVVAALSSRTPRMLDATLVVARVLSDPDLGS